MRKLLASVGRKNSLLIGISLWQNQAQRLGWWEDEIYLMPTRLLILLSQCTLLLPHGHFIGVGKSPTIHLCFLRVLNLLCTLNRREHPCGLQIRDMIAGCVEGYKLNYCGLALRSADLPEMLNFMALVLLNIILLKKQTLLWAFWILWMLVRCGVADITWWATLKTWSDWTMLLLAECTT